MTDRNPPPAAAVLPGFTLLVSLSMVLVFVVVVLSAYIRLGDAGLGCADTQTAGTGWPACFGQLGAHDNRSLVEGGPLLPPSAARTFHRVAATIFSFFSLGIVYPRRQVSSAWWSGRDAAAAGTGDHGIPVGAWHSHAVAAHPGRHHRQCAGRHDPAGTLMDHQPAFATGGRGRRQQRCVAATRGATRACARGVANRARRLDQRQLRWSELSTAFRLRRQAGRPTI